MYTLDDFHLVHAVQSIQDSVYVIEKILKDKSLLSISKSGSGGFFGDELETHPENKYTQKVFMSLIMPNKKGKPVLSKPRRVPAVWFIFDPKLITNYSDCSLQITGGEDISYPHYCKSWNRGSFNYCHKYDISKTLLQNLIEWRNLHFKSKRKNAEFLLNPFVFGTPLNEITIQFSKNENGDCIEGEVPLGKSLQAIFVPLLKRNKEQRIVHEKLRKLAEKYPQYNWIFEE